MLGAATLMAGINFSTSVGDLKPVGIALTLFFAILVFGGPGGAHYNPAVTIAVFIKEGKMSNFSIAAMMMFAQTTGAILSEVFIYATLPKTKGVPANVGIDKSMNILCPYNATNSKSPPCTPESYGQMFWVEVFATWVLASTVLTVKYHYKGTESVCGPLCVGLALFVGISWSASTTGGCLNPAIGIANSLFQWSFAVKNQAYSLNSLWVYICAPLTGGALAGLFQLLNGKAENAMKSNGCGDDFKDSLIQ